MESKFIPVLFIKAGLYIHTFHFIPHLIEIHIRINLQSSNIYCQIDFLQEIFNH